MSDATDRTVGVNHKKPSTLREDRRGFLQKLCAGAAAAAGTQAAAQSANAAETDDKPRKLPTIKIGPHTLTRMIVGGNPIGGYSHSTLNLARHMREYFTLERTVELIARAEKMGLTTWQSDHSKKVEDSLKILRDNGSKIQWICLTSARSGHQPLEKTLALKPIAMVHHGGVTDTLFRKGQNEKVHDFVKQVNDAGVLAGVSSHSPANIAYVADKNWENRLFMCCFYNVLRPGKEIREKLGTVPLGEPFFESDPDEMTAVMQQVEKPCLGFKILAAGRLCSSAHSVESAFKKAFASIKKKDGVIVGIYPKFSDELAQDMDFTIRYGQNA